MQFKVRCARPGEMVVRDEVLEAPDESSVRDSLSAQGLVVLRVRRHSGRQQVSQSLRRQEYGVFCREVRTLIRAGMTVVEAVDTLATRDEAMQRQPELIRALRDRLQQGQSLSHALSGLPHVPPVLLAAVRAGERTSNLAEALDDYLRFDELVQRLRRKVISAAIYPAVVTCLGVAISLFLLMVVMPSFARMYQKLKARSGGLSAGMIELSQWVSEHQLASFAMLAVVAMIVISWVKTGAASRFFMRVALSIPWIRVRIEDFQLAMLYQALVLLLKGGYPLVEAIQISGQAALGPQLSHAVQLARDKILEGTLVSHALMSAGLCDEMDRRLMAAAERNGQFHLAADVVARMHGERFELFVERVTRLVEPFLLLAVALLVGSIVVAMYLPVFDMATRFR